MKPEIASTPRLSTMAPRDLTQAMLRGARRKCPACGQGALYGRYLKVADTCPACGEELHHQRADDAPPYFTILIIGHIVVPLVLAVETRLQPALWVHGVLWLPLTLLLALTILPCVKGALIGLQWALRMHGFGTAARPHDREPAAPEERHFS